MEQIEDKIDNHPIYQLGFYHSNKIKLIIYYLYFHHNYDCSNNLMILN